MATWTLTPMRCIRQWRDKATTARQFHIAFYYVWCALGTPFLILACFGFFSCLMLFPSAALRVGLTFVSYNPGVGWYLYAAAVGIFWSSATIFQIAVVHRQCRHHIFDIEAIASAFFMILGIVVATWYVPHSIERYLSP